MSTAALAVIALALFAGVGFQRSRVANLEKRADDADKRATGSEQEAEALRRRVEDRDRTIEVQAGQIAQLTIDLIALGKVVTGEAHIVALSHQLEEHHNTSETHWASVEGILVGIREDLRGGRA